ncbi:MAG: hypothetical protein QNJ07_11000 [Woeseiaceae bacterium]|nr:hypothetical protein [Woeseiaceae bacterium]
MAGIPLRSTKIVDTAKKLSQRIENRFPDSGLLQVSKELIDIGESARRQAEMIGRPIYPLRIGVGILIAGIFAVVISLALGASDDLDDVGSASAIDLMAAIESGTNVIILIGLAILFLVSLETRIKRSRTLAVVHELRSLAHVIDMHQLNKDPGYYRPGFEATDSSPQTVLSLRDMVRYLEYCSELLSITSKVAAIYAQEMNDRDVLSAVGDVENLVTALGQKIWQKIDIAGEIEQGSA